MGKKKNWQPPAVTPFPQPNQEVSPFVLPVGATQNVGSGAPDLVPVPEGNWTLYCFPDEARAAYQEYLAAALRQGFTQNLQCASGTSEGGSYRQFAHAADGSDIYVVVGTLTDPEGNVTNVSDVLGQRVSAYVFPFSPGKPTYGDKNYKVVDGVDVALPGILQLIGQSSGEPMVPGTPEEGGWARGIWIPVP